MNSIILCYDQREVDAKRNVFKKAKKVTGEFLKCERDTVYLKNGDSVTFVIDDTPEFADEYLPATAFEEEGGIFL